MSSASPVVGTTAASTTSEVFTPQVGRPVCLTLTGVWFGTVTVEKSRDGGVTWSGITIGGRRWATFTGNCDEPFDEAGDNDVRYRLVIVLSSGTVTYRLGH